MSKNGLILVSLVAAVPGALMAGVMAMAFINYAGGPTVWNKLLAVLALLIGLVLMALPVGIFVLGGPKPEKSPEKKASGEAAGEASDSETVIAESGEVSESRAGATDPNLEVVDAESEEFAMTGEIVTGDHDTSSEEFDLGSDFEMGAAEDEVIEAEDELEEDAPKKKKK